MDDLLKQDLISRAEVIYNELDELERLCMPSKRYSATLKFQIRSDETINGRSWCKNNEDHIEINSGVISLYYDYFTKIMKQRKTSIFKSLFESKEENELEDMSYEAIDFRGGTAILIDSRIENDKTAKLLEIFVSRFIILHELGHILNGHCKLLARTQQNSYFIPMYYNEQRTPIDDNKALNIRTLEMDADAFAATQAAYHLIYLYDNFEKQVSVSKMNPQDIFYWWAFALRSHFLVCEDKFADQRYFKKMTHLPSVARWTSIYFSVMKLLDCIKKSKEDTENFKKRITKGAMDAEVEFNKLNWSKYSWTEEASSKEYQEYDNEVHYNWEKMRTMLEEYTRLPLFKASK